MPRLPFVRVTNSLVVIVHGDAHGLLGSLLANDVLIQVCFNFCRLGQRVPIQVGLLSTFIIQYLVTQPNALIADVDGGSSDDLVDLADTLSAKRATDRISGFFQQGSFTRKCSVLGLPPLRLTAFGEETTFGRVVALGF